MGAVSLGFDLGGTQIRAALVQDGTIRARAALRTDVAGGPEAVMLQFQVLAATVGAQDAAAIGVASPGPIDTVTGVIDAIPTLPGWDGFALKARLSDLFGQAVLVENDGISAAYGEWRHGAGRGLANIVFATVSTGIGGGVVVDGHLLHGRRGMAAHIGHLRLSFDGPVCNCGAPGCFEAYASGTALGQRGREHAALSPDSHLGRIATATGVPDARDVVEGARTGDADCLALIAEEARLLGHGFINLAHLYSPDRIILGGGVSQAFDLLDADLHATIRAKALPAFKRLRVVPAALGDNAGLMGVANLALATQAD
jgi:glucokinase